MALDWGKDRSSANSKPSNPGAMPSKTTMNLVSVDTDKENNPAYVAVVGVVLAILVILFAKFGVLDPLGTVNAKQGELARAQQDLADTQDMLADYNNVLSEYQSYMGTQQGDTPDALVVIDTLYDVTGSRATITGVSMTDDKVTVNLSDTSLDKVGDIADQLRSQPIVSSVSVTTAGNSGNAGNGFTSTITVTLVGGEEN